MPEDDKNKGQTTTGSTDTGSEKSLTNNDIMGIIGSLIPSSISGNNTQAGSILSTVGTGAMLANPVVGAAIKAGALLLNEAIGSNVNQGVVDNVSSQLNTANNQILGSTSIDSLMSAANNLSNVKSTVNTADFGTQGWFNHDIDDIKNNFASQLNRSNQSIGNTGMNIAKTNINNILKNTLAEGGFMGNGFTNGVTEVNAGGTHEANPYGGVFMGEGPDGQPNQVEEGEVIYKDYVFSNRIPVPKEIRSKYKLRDSIKTFAEAFKALEEESKERPNDPISKNGLESIATDLIMSQEMKRQNQKTHKYDEGGRLWASLLPTLGATVYNLFDTYKPTKVSYPSAPVKNEVTAPSNYLSRTPFDRNYWTNQLLASQAGARRGLTSDAARLANDYNSNIQLGAMARQGEEYNLNDKYKTAEFNRGTDQFKASIAMQNAQNYNSLLNAYNNARLEADKINVANEMTHKQGIDTAFGTNMTNIGKTLGDYQKEKNMLATIKELADKGAFGSTDAATLLTALSGILG